MDQMRRLTVKQRPCFLTHLAMRYRWTHKKWELMVADQWFKVYQTDCAIGGVNYVLYPKSTFYLQEVGVMCVFRSGVYI